MRLGICVLLISLQVLAAPEGEFAADVTEVVSGDGSYISLSFGSEPEEVSKRVEKVVGKKKKPAKGVKLATAPKASKIDPPKKDPKEELNNKTRLELIQDRIELERQRAGFHADFAGLMMASSGIVTEQMKLSDLAKTLTARHESLVLQQKLVREQSLKLTAEKKALNRKIASVKNSPAKVSTAAMRREQQRLNQEKKRLEEEKEILLEQDLTLMRQLAELTKQEFAQKK